MAAVSTAQRPTSPNLPKRFRFGARDRDEDIGWDDRGARYYVPALARWANPDPGGMLDGTNRYWFVRANPIRNHDPTGLSAIDSTTGKVVDPRSGGTVLTTTTAAPGKTPIPKGHWIWCEDPPKVMQPGALVAKYNPATDPTRLFDCPDGEEARWESDAPAKPPPPKPPPPARKPPPKQPDPKLPEVQHDPPVDEQSHHLYHLHPHPRSRNPTRRLRPRPPRNRQPPRSHPATRWRAVPGGRAAGRSYLEA